MDKCIKTIVQTFLFTALYSKYLRLSGTHGSDLQRWSQFPGGVNQNLVLDGNDSIPLSTASFPGEGQM